MRFAFTEEQQQFRDSAREVLRRRCPASAVRQAWANPSGRVPGLWAELAEVGIVGMTAPEAARGLGMTELDWVLVFEESGRVALPEPLIETTAVAVPLLAELGDAALVERWLPLVCSGRAAISVGLPLAPHVLYRTELVVLAGAGELHAVPGDRVELWPRPAVDRSRRLYVADWQPAPDTCLAAGSRCVGAVGRASDRGALAAAAQLLGLAGHLLEATVDYATVRRQFRRPIGAFQAVKHQLADAHVAVEFARPLVYRAAYSLAHGGADGAVHVSMAKAAASEAALGAARVALQCHGAVGYSFEYDLHLWMKRVWALAATWGDAAWHRRRVADQLLGAPG
jgi:alkylation response protein AidB-like acyl-CoA dehydrogenase